MLDAIKNFSIAQLMEMDLEEHERNVIAFIRNNQDTDDGNGEMERSEHDRTVVHETESESIE